MNHYTGQARYARWTEHMRSRVRELYDLTILPWSLLRHGPSRGSGVAAAIGTYAEVFVGVVSGAVQVGIITALLIWFASVPC